MPLLMIKVSSTYHCNHIGNLHTRMRNSKSEGQKFIACTKIKKGKKSQLYFDSLNLTVCFLSFESVCDTLASLSGSFLSSLKKEEDR